VAGVADHGRLWTNVGHHVFLVDLAPLSIVQAYEVVDMTWGLALAHGNLWIPFLEKGLVRQFQP
jgi:hypothetical protein